MSECLIVYIEDLQKRKRQKSERLQQIQNERLQIVVSTTLQKGKDKN